MGDDSTLLPPSSGDFSTATPSGLTPNTRSEAEAALTLNSIAQTDSAAPTTPMATREGMHPFMGAGGGNTVGQEDGADEAREAYKRPPGPLRTSSTNYESAIREARKNSSVSSNFSTETHEPNPENITGSPTASPTSTTTHPLPPPGQGVVPLHTGVGGGQADVVKKAKAKASGLNLGMLGRQQSWNEQDLKHVYNASLMGGVQDDAGYRSGTEGKGVGS